MHRPTMSNVVIKEERCVYVRTSATTTKFNCLLLEIVNAIDIHSIYRNHIFLLNICFSDAS